ncbi:MAG TPA: DUF2497 domain-containing protein [Acetobacteraceae bacterium]|jgi:hypothetical protein
MEDILASIRRILSDDEQAAASHGGHPEPDAPPPSGKPPVLALSEDMLVSEPAQPHRPEPLAAPASDRSFEPHPELSPEPPPGAAPMTREPLVAPAAEAAAASSVGTLLRALIAEREQVHVHRGGPTIEDLVREEIRPLLKAWLDANLPSVVERLVRAEIERVVGRAFP